MSYIVVGLGNPGEEYEKTRHNTGRLILETLAVDKKVELETNKKASAHTALTSIGKEKVLLIAPDTFMNNSGKALTMFVKSKAAAEKLIVIYDDFNLPLGRLRISFNRSSGGHNGLESVIKAVKTEAFVRLRIGVAPATAKGVAKVPHGDDKIERFILGKYKDDEWKIFKKITKVAIEAITTVVTESREKAMSIYNSYEI